MHVLRLPCSLCGRAYIKQFYWINAVCLLTLQRITYSDFEMNKIDCMIKVRTFAMVGAIGIAKQMT